MAEDLENTVQDGEEESESPSAGVNKKKMLLLLLPLFLVVGTVVGVYFSGMADSFLTVKEKAPSEKKASSKTQPSSFFYDVPEILVNLSSRAGQKPIYFKIKISLEMPTSADVEQTERLLPRVIDSLQFYLREMRLEELQGSMGTYRLKEEILGRLNRVLAPAKVDDVLIKEILIQ